MVTISISTKANRAITTASILFLKCSSALVPSDPMDDKLTPADPSDLANSIAFALWFNRRKRFHEGDKLMADITADHIIRYLDDCGYFVMKRPPIGGSAPRNPPSGWPHTKPEDRK
jgi:hypothetical protein